MKSLMRHTAATSMHLKIIDFREEYQTLLHALEDIRVEKKLQKRFSGGC